MEGVGGAGLRRPCQGPGISLVFPAGRPVSCRGVVWQPYTSTGPSRCQVSRPLIRNEFPEDLVVELATDLKVLLK